MTLEEKPFTIIKKGKYFVAQGAKKAHKYLFSSGDWKFMPVLGGWFTPTLETAMQHFDAMAPEVRQEVETNYRTLREALEASTAIDADIDIPAPPGLSYRPYQKAGVQFMLHRKDTILADSPRLGKTNQVLGLINMLPKTEKVLILCPSNAKIHWHRKIDEWLINKNLRTCICEGSLRVPADIYICNWEILHHHIDFFREIEWDILAIDEAHALQSDTSNRTKAILGEYDKKRKTTKLKEGIPYKKRIFITGTPVYTRPVGLWPILRAADPTGLGKDYYLFVTRYCDAKPKANGHGMDVKGYSNSEELQLKMRKSVMIRREKKDIGHEIQSFKDTIVFPQTGLEKLVRTEREEFTKYHDRLADLLAGNLTEEVCDELIEHFGHLDGLDRKINLDADGDGQVDDLTQPTIREKLALAKLPMCVEFIKDTLETEKKVVIFAHHRRVINALREAFPDAAYLMGAMPKNKRQANIDRFQNDPDCRIFIGNILAAGQAIELSASDCIIFVEISWVPAEMDQAEERVWLVTKEQGVSIYYLVVEGTIEETMAYALRIRRDKIRRTLNKDALKNYTNTLGNRIIA